MSGVLRSSFKISFGGLVGGGRGYRESAGAELVLLEFEVDSLLVSDFGGVGGSRREVSGNSVPGWFVCAFVKGGSSDIRMVSVDILSFWSRKVGVRCGSKLQSRWRRESGEVE